MASIALTGQEYTVYRSKDGAIIGTNTRIPPLGPRDVLIRITHSGVCNADAMYASMGAPIALGHEGVGLVEAVGSEVTQLSPGDRAGGGYHRGSCGTCRYCLSGQDIYCDQRVIFGSGEPDNGTFAQYYIGKETYVHKIPELISSAHAAPLQCAGAATYVALKSTIRPTSRVGVIGIGGLGHLAIQFAAQLGGEVVALSTTREKQEEALGLGAREFVLLEQLPLKRPLDVLVVASSRYPDWDKILDQHLLARCGVVVPLTASPDPLSLPAGPMLSNGWRVHFSLVASRADHDEMLRFAAIHGIRPLIQTYKFDGASSIEKAFKDIRENKVRYRVVLEL